MAAAGMLAIASVALACSVGTTPDLVVPLDTRAHDKWELLVYDESGLVTAARSGQWQSGFPTDALLAFPDRQELEVYWTGGACSHRPTLQISGDASDLLLVVSNRSDPQLLPFLPVACPAAGILLWVTISLSEPVEQSAVGIAVSY